jgi:hypothetical protein
MLKQLIQRLLDSRTTPAQAGHNAMPVNIAEAIDIFLAVGSEGSYTAPADGYLSAMVEPGGNMNFWGQILPISSFPIQNVQGKLFVPMAKGMEVRYFINGTVSLSKFLKTIGGGYNLFVWRTLSCLRALSNFSQRSFCKVKSLGFLNSVLRLSAMAQTFLAQAPRTSLAMLHRATAGRLLGAIQAQSQLLKFKSIMGKWHLLPSSTETPLGVVSAVTSKKEPLLNSYAEAETHRIIPFGSTKQVQTFNPLTGGALC